MYKDYEIKLNAILDKHKEPKRFDFKDIKTLEKLTGELKSLVSKLDDSKIKSEIGNYDKVNEELKKISAILDRAEDGISISKKKVEEAKKELEADNKAYLKVDKKHDTAYKKKETAAAKVFNANDKYMSNWLKAESISDKLEDAIFLVEKGAKDLGVKVSVSQYEAQIANFYKNDKDPLSKLDMDY